MPIVEHLEVVDVDGENARGVAKSLGSMKLVLQTDAEQAAVAQAGEVIVLGTAPKLVEGLCMANR
jgi:hypothetical protein